MPARAFENAKQAAMRRLAAARSAGSADPGAAGCVDALNAHRDWFTSSSCSGRVQLLALPRPGDKAGARVLGRWHGPPGGAELDAALAARPPALAAHLFVEPPILHLVAADLGSARALLRLGHAAGFKASHVRSLARSGFVTVELGDTSRLATPVASPAWQAPAGFLDLLASEAPALLARGHARLDNLGALAVRGVALPASRMVQEVAERG